MPLLTKIDCLLFIKLHYLHQIKSGQPTTALNKAGQHAAESAIR